MKKSFRLVTEIRYESTDFIGARSIPGCNEAEYKSAIHPARRNTRRHSQTGRRSYKSHIGLYVNATRMGNYFVIPFLIHYIRVVAAERKRNLRRSTVR